MENHVFTLCQWKYGRQITRCEFGVSILFLGAWMGIEKAFKCSKKLEKIVDGFGAC